MATETAKRDPNYVTTLMGVDMTTGLEPTKVYVDETTHRLLVSAVITSDASTAEYATKIEEHSSTPGIFFVGKAALTGSAIPTSSAVWQIKRLDTTAIDLDKKYADGDALFNNIWDDRESLTYN